MYCICKGVEGGRLSRGGIGYAGGGVSGGRVSRDRVLEVGYPWGSLSIG